MNAAANEALTVKMVLTAWHGQNTKMDDLLKTLSDEQLAAETAPGRNTGTYLFGHFIAVNDGLFKLLGIGERMHPELDEIFLRNPDKSGFSIPSIDDLKTYWQEVNTALTEKFNQMQPADWFARHTSVSEEDFAKEPHRNRLNVIITRTVHQAYHLGQMAYLKKATT
ncbi:MAG TPA: DinB family protein [Panacibacter sp.]|nr:DinB family protein [Panacibacter sp.]HNP44008.1 DinB family protein [Panacibacter sp.]